MEPSHADWDHLRRYVIAGDDRAFAALVAAHVDLVYAAALRQVRSPELAEEVAQAVFIILSRKAATIARTTVLAAWLHRTAFYTARNAVRQQARRRRHERRAATTEATADPRRAPPTWQRLAPTLDAGVAGLRAADRQAIVLRFFQQKSLADVGRAMGISEDAAQMRVSRAVDKLRAFFARRGVSLDACALANVVWANAARPAPPRVSAAVVRGVRGMAPAHVSGVANAAAHAMKRARAMAVAAVVLATLAAVGGTIFLLQQAVVHGPLAPHMAGHDSYAIPSERATSL